MKDALMYCLTNKVMQQDIAKVCKIMGGNPMMAEEISELEDIIPYCKSMLLNMGTPTEERFRLANKSCVIANVHSIPIVLDPVGCGQSEFRLSHNMALLNTYQIQCLKVNFAEAISLLEEKLRTERNGVDGKGPLHQDAIVDVGRQLYDKFSRNNPELVVVVTGRVDIIISKNGIETIESRRNDAARLIGTGCMLGAMIAALIPKVSYNLGKVAFEAVSIMKKAAENATLSMRGSYLEGEFHLQLFNHLSRLQPKIYAITDDRLDFEQEILPRGRWMLKEGIDFFQYRNKKASIKVMEKELLSLKDLCHEYGTPLIVNDFVELAKYVEADGVHLGATDSKIWEAREKLGNQIIGATVKTIEQGKMALNEGADYLGVGALYLSQTKPLAIPFSHDNLKLLKESISIPIFGIGGIEDSNITHQMMQSLDGVALISTLFMKENEASMIHIIQKLRATMRREKWEQQGKITTIIRNSKKEKK